MANNLGKEILRLRKDLGLTQRELGYEVQVDGSYICKVENGGRVPTDLFLVRLQGMLKSSNLLSTKQLDISLDVIDLGVTGLENLGLSTDALKVAIDEASKSIDTLSLP